MKKAEWDSDECSWSVTSDGSSLGPAASLYTGSAGIALFLTELWRVEPDPEILRFATAAAKHSIHRVPRSGWGSGGLYFGAAGASYVAARLAGLSSNDTLWRESQEALASIATDEHPPFDLTVGVAGSILATLFAFQTSRQERFIALARELGDYLLDEATRHPFGISWASITPRAANLTGVSHGNSGICLALLELWNVTRDSRYAEAVEHAFAFEDRYYDETSHNWLDLRFKPWLDLQSNVRQLGREETLRRMLEVSGYAANAAQAWCHGASGIALVRFRAASVLGNESYRAQVEQLIPFLRESLRSESPGNLTLCCGKLGRAEVLRTIGSDAASKDTCDQVGIETMSYARTLCDASREYPVGFMTGLAGLGYSLLRQFSGNVPNPLLLGSHDNTPRCSGTVAPTPTQTEVYVNTGALKRSIVGSIVGDALDRARILLGPAGIALDAHIDARVNKSAPGSEVAEALNTVNELSVMVASPLAELVEDACRVDRLRVELLANPPWFCDEELRELHRSRTAEPSWTSGTVEIRRTARFAKTKWDWDAWSETGYASAFPPEREVTYLVYSKAGDVKTLRLTGSEALLFESFKNDRLDLGTLPSESSAQARRVTLNWAHANGIIHLLPEHVISADRHAPITTA